MQSLELYAHSKNADGAWHVLQDHLQAVAQRAATFAEPLEAAGLARLAGWLHDIGKANPAFQAYLSNATHDPAHSGHGPDHKGAGAVLAMQMRLDLLAFLIAGHHGGLPARAHLKVWLRERAGDPAVQEAIHLARRAFPEITQQGTAASRLLPTALHTPSEVEFFLRLLFSTLVDADFLDTEAHFRTGGAGIRSGSPPITALWEILERYQRDQNSQCPASLLNTLRQQVYQQCCEAATWSPGLFRLTVPTGGGKTRSSLAFALRHATSHGLRRVIYAIPYLSITEQTADVFRTIFPDPQVVLEHHSGIYPPDDPASLAPESLWQRLAAENWDAPLIVTTTVQLFESLLAHSPSACRKLHNIAGSVLILDEAQMLPTHLLETVLDVLHQLVYRYHVTVVLCTATQPALDQRRGFPGLQGIREIIPDAQVLFAALTRVRYQWPQTGERWSWQQVAARMRTVSQALAIVNTRADAVKLAQVLSDVQPLHLSTSMCGAHRRAVIQQVRRRLLAGENCHLVSTQLLEAGVDLDFPLVLRALGPLDSIAQAAGRCNREGTLAQGTVIVFDPLEGSLPPGPYRTGTMLTQALLRQGSLDLAHPETYQHYFERYYALVDRDEPHVQAARSQFDYPEAATRFRMIEEQVSVIVAYEPAEKPTQVAELLKAITQQPMQRRSLLRQLQPYTVQLRPTVFAAAMQRRLVQELLPGLWLWQGTYDATYGLTFDERSGHRPAGMEEG